MKTIKKGEPLAPLFVAKPNVVLWRAVGFWHGCTICHTDLFHWQPTERGGFMARCQLNGSFTAEPEVYPDDGKMTRGLVVFVDSLPPKDFTHLLVKGVSKALYENIEDGIFKKGTAVFATVPRPYSMDDYKKFRCQMAQHYLNNVIRTSSRDFFSTMLDGCLRINTTERRSEERRLVVERSYHTGDYRYAHVYFPEEENHVPK